MANTCYDKCHLVKHQFELGRWEGPFLISPFIETLNVPAVVVPMANKDNNQHSPNENIRLGNYVDGVKAMYYILMTDIEE